MAFNRDSILNLPILAGATVTQATDAATCTRARHEYAKVPMIAPESTFSVEVVRVGTYYLVVDPAQRTREWASLVVFDERWKLVAGMEH
jgi:hypothetical protein